MKIQLINHDAHKHITIQPVGSDVIGKITRTGPRSHGVGALVLLDDWSFVQITDGVRMPLDQRKVYTAIIRAILAEFCDEQIDLALSAGYSMATIKSWRLGARVPAFGVIRMLLANYKIIEGQYAII